MTSTAIYMVLVGVIVSDGQIICWSWQVYHS